MNATGLQQFMNNVVKKTMASEMRKQVEWLPYMQRQHQQ